MSGFLVLRMRNPFGWRWRANRASLKRCKQHLFLTLRALSGSNPSFSVAAFTHEKSSQEELINRTGGGGGMSGFLVLRMRNPFGWRWRANRASLKRCKQHLFLTLRALSGSNPSFSVAAFTHEKSSQEELINRTGGGGGIRTLVTLAGQTVFETAAFNHSATPPHGVKTGRVCGAP